MSRTSRTRGTHGANASHDLLEHRLRTALDARVRAVGLDDLRRASPPSLRVSTRRLPARTATLALVGLAAVLACVLLVPWEGRPPEPVPPAHPSVTHSPRLTRTSTPSPHPEPSRPRGAPPAAPASIATSTSSGTPAGAPAVPVPDPG